MYDLIIVDTQVVDGTGNPWRHGNVAVKGGRIVAVGSTLSDEAIVTLDGRGLVTCPGFIDFHAHSDLSLLVNPRAESAIRQGITTQVNGNCGISGAPLTPEETTDLHRISLYADQANTIAAIPYTWGSMAEYLDLLRQHGSAINFVTMVGNSNLRRIVIGEEERSYGTFPRVLGRFVRDRGVLPLEEAVRKMTTAPAARLGLTDRGLLRAGFAADICVFDPQTVIDRADWENTEVYPEGIETVIVNGQIVIQDGEHTGALPGRVLVP
jgi:N-acyl-D-aspartate/D-glutamate deacylase